MEFTQKKKKKLTSKPTENYFIVIYVIIIFQMLYLILFKTKCWTYSSKDFSIVVPVFCAIKMTIYLA